MSTFAPEFSDMEFSVLLSIYKDEKPLCLCECLDSLFSQTVTATEIILVEDGKLTPELYQIIEEYKQHHREIKTIRLNTNSGLGNALNEGMKYCSYDLIARMDTDDICKPDRFKKQIAYMERHPECDILSSWVDEFIGNTSHIVSTRKLPENHDAIVKYGKKRNPINHPAVIFRRKAVVAAGGYPHFPKAQVEDYELWVRMIVNGALFHNIQESLLYYRLSDDFARRRGGWNYSRREIPLQISFYKKGYISWWRMTQNIAIRTVIRMLPSSWRRKVYLKFLR